MGGTIDEIEKYIQHKWVKLKFAVLFCSFKKSPFRLFMSPDQVSQVPTALAKLVKFAVTFLTA